MATISCWVPFYFAFQWHLQLICTIDREVPVSSPYFRLPCNSCYLRSALTLDPFLPVVLQVENIVVFPWLCCQHFEIRCILILPPHTPFMQISFQQQKEKHYAWYDYNFFSHFFLTALKLDWMHTVCVYVCAHVCVHFPTSVTQFFCVACGLNIIWLKSIFCLLTSSNAWLHLEKISITAIAVIMSCEPVQSVA